MKKDREIPPMHPASAMDFLPLAQLRDVQFVRLQDMVQRAYDRVPLFRQRMEERKLKPADLRSMDDIVKLPFTVKTDLRDTYPFGLLASPMKDIVRFHASSGSPCCRNDCNCSATERSKSAIAPPSPVERFLLA